MSRTVPAPELNEVAETWWDVDHDPVVAWDGDGTTFVLMDPADRDNALALIEVEEPLDDPEDLALVLAEGLASCDFPPTEERAAPGRVLAALRSAGVSVTPIEGWADAQAS